MLAACFLQALICGVAAAEEARPLPSPTLTGAAGLNTVPSARMQNEGTISAGVSTLDPYLHGYLGFQIAKPLWIGVRQTAETSSLNEDADRLYPGIDMKLRLMQEDRFMPEIAVGLNAAMGHKRMAAQYLAASKRYGDFDFTTGIGWGRLAEDGAEDGEMPVEPGDWFSGGLSPFAGVEYFTPLDGLSLKLDYSADTYGAEQSSFDFDPGARWSAGLSYWLMPWANIGLAAQGDDKVMARLTLQTNAGQWGNKNQSQSSVIMKPARGIAAMPALIDRDAAGEGQILQGTSIEGQQAATTLRLKPGLNTPLQIGQAAIHMANQGGRDVEELAITPAVMGLRGPQIRLLRRDLEQALIHRQGSATEIWRRTEFTAPDDLNWRKTRRPAEVQNELSELTLTWDTQLSLSEEDEGTLYRSGLLLGARGPSVMGLFDTGARLRLNAMDNLEDLAALRGPFVSSTFIPARSDVDLFAARGVSVDQLYTTFTHSLTPNLHTAVTAGYLEEMYAGIGGEILYRPFDSRLAIGAEAWQAAKRDPLSALNLGFAGYGAQTAALNLWYDEPHFDVTLQAQLARYLAEDTGVSFRLQKHFKNGAKLETFVTVTDQADFDLFGGTTHAYHGVSITWPLGVLAKNSQLPVHTDMRVTAAPQGRDAGQALNNPVPLYELTEPFSKGHMSRHWDEVVQ